MAGDYASDSSDYASDYDPGSPYEPGPFSALPTHPGVSRFDKSERTFDKKRQNRIESRERLQDGRKRAGMIIYYKAVTRDYRGLQRLTEAYRNAIPIKA